MNEAGDATVKLFAFFGRRRRVGFRLIRIREGFIFLRTRFGLFPRFVGGVNGLSVLGLFASLRFGYLRPQVVQLDILQPNFLKVAPLEGCE